MSVCFPRIAVTGMGIVSALGRGKAATLDSLLSSRSGVAPMSVLDSVHTDLPVGEVKETTEALAEALGVSPSIPTTRSALLGLMAIDEALEQAALSPISLREAAFVSATTVGGMDQSERYYLDFLTGDERNDYIALHDVGACTDWMASRYGPWGYVASVSTACSSAANAIIHGARLIAAGECRRVIAGGTECLTRFHLNGFNTLLILDHRRSRPFSASRAGLNLGEGAAFLVLEDEQIALERGQSPLAYVTGWGNACDAYHQTATSADGEGPYLAMKQALERAQLLPSDISYINAHGTGTPDNDRSEFAALQRLFGEALPPFSSTKPFTGHTTSASGSIESVICLLAMQHGFIPPNLSDGEMLSPSCHPVAELQRRQTLRHVMCNSFGFGGNDSALIFSFC